MDRRPAPWRTREVVSISLSAFFADLGYQAVLAGFPLFLVLSLHAPIWLFGLATAVSYGGGSLVAYLGGRLGDRVGHRRVAIAGNSFIPLLSLSALFSAPAAAISFLTLGWWARNVRTPSRRVMLTRAVAPSDQGAAFGFLHGLDVGGGMLAAAFVLGMLFFHVAWRWIFLLTALPLIVSTLALAQTRLRDEPVQQMDPEAKPQQPAPGMRSLLWAAGLYGLSSYSVGFPVLTVAQGTGQGAFGILAFLVLQGVSALTGLLLGARLGRTLLHRFRNLALLGYAVACAGSLLLAAAYGLHAPTALLFLGVAVLGFALGVVETLEPSLIGMLSRAGYAGRGFGALSAARSIGLFAANIALGLLYSLGAGYAYSYAALLAALAAGVLLFSLPWIGASAEMAS
ncbi:MAG: MFS transporter [Thermaerobacter sp.]|nr:MFS transporter [Thermaerobacter sp.]